MTSVGLVAISAPTYLRRFSYIYFFRFSHMTNIHYKFYFHFLQWINKVCATLPTPAHWCKETQLLWTFETVPACVWTQPIRWTNCGCDWTAFTLWRCGSDERSISQFHWRHGSHCKRQIYCDIFLRSEKVRTYNWKYPGHVSKFGRKVFTQFGQLVHSLLQSGWPHLDMGNDYNARV